MIAFVLLAITGISIWFFGGTYFKGKTILKNAGLALALSSFALLFVHECGALSRICAKLQPLQFSTNAQN